MEDISITTTTVDTVNEENESGLESMEEVVETTIRLLDLIKEGYESREITENVFVESVKVIRLLMIVAAYKIGGDTDIINKIVDGFGHDNNIKY